MRSRKYCVLGVAGVAMAGVVAAVAWAAAPAPVPAAAVARRPAGAEFEGTVGPVIQKYCVGCHSGEEPAGDFSLAFKTEGDFLKPGEAGRAHFEKRRGCCGGMRCRRRASRGKGARETSEVAAQREQWNLSILDFVRDQAKDIHKQLGSANRHRMDDYLTSIREIERRIAQPPGEVSPEIAGSMERPTRIPPTFIEKYTKINEYHVRALTYFLEKMKSVREGEGTLLDNSMIVYGGGCAAGNSHAHTDLPVLMFGRGGGTITPGRKVTALKDTPICNLNLSMFERMGVKAERFGDSTGLLPGLM